MNDYISKDLSEVLEIIHECSDNYLEELNLIATTTKNEKNRIFASGGYNSVMELRKKFNKKIGVKNERYKNNKQNRN